MKIFTYMRTLWNEFWIWWYLGHDYVRVNELIDSAYKQDPMCHHCGLVLSTENLMRQAKMPNQEQMCKHGQTNFPTYDEKGFLSGYINLP